MNKIENSKKNIKISIEEIPRMSFRIFLMLIPLVIIPFFLLYGNDFREEIRLLGEIIDQSVLIFTFKLIVIVTVFLLFIIIGVIAHEFIHALCFSFFLPSKFKGVNFGINKEHGIPYVHINEPISVIGLRIGALMPLLLLGVIPILVGIYSGSIGLTVFGIIFTISASGDLLIIAKTKGLLSHQKVEDLTDEIGFRLV